MSRFYITTPIYYVNALPHLGTFYTTVVADAFARYQRARAKSRGEDPKGSVFFLTGLDEHGQKIERIARERSMQPQAYCDEIAAKFQETWKAIGISNDDFIRTTSPRHKAAATEMWARLATKKGPDGRPDLFEAEYDGMYCVGCEEAKSEDDVVADGDRKLCKIHLTPVEKVKEKNYFFRLSAYADKLLAWYDTNPVRPESRLNEVRSFVKGGLRDLSISRSTVKWGIPVPGDPKQTMYVWIDALTNYLTVLGGPDAVARGEGKGAFWAGAHHLIAKDILRFHAVYWPALLMSAGLPPPKQIFCHGYLTVKGQKISKSMPATRVDPMAIAAEMGVDPLRYFVLREYTFGGDGDFTYETLFQRYQSDLGNDLGNLLNRTLSMVHRYGRLDALTKPDSKAATSDGPSSGEIQAIEAPWEQFQPSTALNGTWHLVRKANLLIDSSKPWVLAKETDSSSLDNVLLACCESLRWAAMMVAPAMPEASREILRQLGCERYEGSWPTEWRWPGGTLAEPQPVFPRIEPERQAALIAQWVPAEAAPAAAATTAPAAASAPPADVSIDDFAKIELRAAKVLSAERVPKADKLLKLTLDIGTDEPRTVVSGIAPTYTPEAMIGRTVIYFANLAPRKIRGVLSQGMILAAGDADVLGLSALDREVPTGTKIR
ncbi:MAG TPA: methionine--tRNA ligase [Polyangia bacterium]|jgi:methionyl-tRNA synthetase